MTEPRKRSPILPVAGAAAMLLAGYVGAYYAMVTRETAVTSAGSVVTWPSYSFDRLELMFSPIHWLDRRLRPHVWE